MLQWNMICLHNIHTYNSYDIFTEADVYSNIKCHYNCCPLSESCPESEGRIVVQNPLHVVGHLDEHTGLLTPTDGAEDDEATQVVVTLSLAGQGRPAIQSQETSGLFCLSSLAPGTDDVGEQRCGVLLLEPEVGPTLAGADDVQLCLP